MVLPDSDFFFLKLYAGLILYYLCVIVFLCVNRQLEKKKFTGYQILNYKFIGCNLDFNV